MDCPLCRRVCRAYLAGYDYLGPVYVHYCEFCDWSEEDDEE